MKKSYFFVFCFIPSTIRLLKAWRLEQNLIMDVTGRDGGGRAEPDGRRVWWGGRALDLPPRELAVRPRWPWSPWTTPRWPLHGSDGGNPPRPRAQFLDHTWGEGTGGTPSPSQFVTFRRNGTEEESTVVMHDRTAARWWCCTETWTAMQECITCIAALHCKSKSKPVKSLLKPFFHHRTAKPTSPPSSRWFNRGRKNDCNAIREVICRSSQQFIQLWSLKSFWSILWINSALTARMWAGRAELNWGGDLAPGWLRCQKSRYPHTHNTIVFLL